MSSKRIGLSLLAIAIFVSFSLSSCASSGYNTQKGAAIGAGIGAIAGQAIGRNTQGTLIGTAAGALAGAILGNAFDQDLMWTKLKETEAKTTSCDRTYEECPPGKWVQVPGKWVGGKWVPSHKVWVPQDP